jgi:hypothetical protein
LATPPVTTLVRNRERIIAARSIQRRSNIFLERHLAAARRGDVASDALVGARAGFSACCGGDVAN